MARNRVNRSTGGDVGIFIILFIFGVLMVLPMFYAIITSLKPLDELWIFPPRFWVAKPTLKNFADLFSNLSNSWVPFSRYIFNTVFISVVGTFGHVIIASMAAYALSKKRFYGSKAIFKVIVTSLMFSGSTAIPTFIIMSKLGFIDTYWSIILPAFSSTLGLYLMKQHMESMVKDTIIEAAKIDGAGESFLLPRPLECHRLHLHLHRAVKNPQLCNIADNFGRYFPSRCRRRLGGVYDDTAYCRVYVLTE